MQAHDPHNGMHEKKAILSKALIRLAEHLALSRRELCHILGLSEATLSRLFEGKKLIDPHSKEGELTILLIRLYRSLEALFGGNMIQCRLWLRSQNHHLGFPPIDLIQSITGLAKTVIYLDAIRAKN